MLRAATLLSLAALPLAAFAAPVPQPSEKELIARHWGKTEGGGEFKLEGKQLTLRSTSGKANHQFRWAEDNPVPRTGRVVRGDFEITVRVVEALPPNKDAKCDTGMPETCAGLYIQGGESNFRYHLSQAYQKVNGELRPELRRWLQIQANYPRGGASGSMKQAEDGKSAYLRLTRKDGAVAMSYSFDGETWSAPNNPFRNIDMGIPDEVTVGVFVSHSTCQFAHATFDGFTVGKPAGGKAK